MDMSQRLAKKIPRSAFHRAVEKPYTAPRALKPELVLSVIEAESTSTASRSQPPARD